MTDKNDGRQVTFRSFLVEQTVSFSTKAGLEKHRANLVKAAEFANTLSPDDLIGMSEREGIVTVWFWTRDPVEHGSISR